MTRRGVLYFIGRMLFLAAEKPQEPILMQICFPGAALAQSDEIIRLMDKLSCPVHTHCCGTVGGTAVVIAAHGQRGCRTAMSNCRFSLSPGTSGSDGEGSGEPLPQEMVDLLVRDAGEGVLRLLKGGEEFSAQDALEAGIVDHIIPTPVRGGGVKR